MIPSRGGGRGGLLPKMAYTGRIRFFRFQIYKRIRIELQFTKRLRNLSFGYLKVPLIEIVRANALYGCIILVFFNIVYQLYSKSFESIGVTFFNERYRHYLSKMVPNHF